MTIFRFSPTFALLALALTAGCKEEAADSITLPSGREVTPIDVITDTTGPNGATARFRFLAPDLAEEDAESAAVDLQALCDTYALPRIKGAMPEPQQIVVSLSSEPVPFGETAPDVVQFFEAYRPENGTCQWEPF